MRLILDTIPNGVLVVQSHKNHKNVKVKYYNKNFGTLFNCPIVDDNKSFDDC